MTTCAEAIKKPADNLLESVAMILPPNPAIFNDFIVFIPAGPAAPGTRTDVIFCLTGLSLSLIRNRIYSLYIFNNIEDDFIFSIVSSSVSIHASMYIRRICLCIYQDHSMLSTSEDYHIHCNYNDHSSPDLTVSNVVKHAENTDLKVIAFADPVRTTSHGS